MALRLGTWTLAWWLAACGGGDGTSPDASGGDGPGDTDTPTDTDLPPPPPDTDGDGLSDADEVALGTDPNNADSDDDGVVDGEEVALGIDPLARDTDADALDDGAEITAGTNPALADTDGDTLLDGNEVAIGTDPLLVDTDADGLDDGADIAAGGDPLLADTDGDGLSDGDEVALGTGVKDPDSDNDQLWDGDEVFYQTDPFDVDTDGDRLIDGTEVDIGTDPTNPDTDGDSLTDYEEVDELLSDPLDADSDNDTLLDGDEVDVYDTSPALADTDADGLTDDVEVFGVTDPRNPDSDGDSLLDGDEVNVHHTDPLNPDTDGGTLDDGSEVALGSDPLDASDDVCTFPTVDVSAVAGPGGAVFEPATVRVWFDGLPDEGVLKDFDVDTDADGVFESTSSVVVFEIRDAAAVQVCTITWDGNLLTPGTPWATDSGGVLFGTWALQLTAASAATDCPPIDVATWGVGTLPELFEGVDWELGVGELVSLVPGVSADVSAAGGDWAADWEPYVVGTYLKSDGLQGQEMGFSRGEATTCAEVLDDGAGGPVYAPAPVAGDTLPRTRLHTEGYVDLELSSLLQGEDCADGSLLVGWLPGWGGSYANGSLAWNDVAVLSQSGPCVVTFVDVAAGFTKDSLTLAGIDVLVITDPAGQSIQYSANELSAIRDYAVGGYGGIVATYLLEFNGADDTDILDLLGVDPAGPVMGFAGVKTKVTVLDAAHPLTANLPLSFDLISYPSAQLFNTDVRSNLLPGASIVMADLTDDSVAVVYEGADWRGVWFTGMADFTPTNDDVIQALLNAVIWASGPD